MGGEEFSLIVEASESFSKSMSVIVGADKAEPFVFVFPSPNFKRVQGRQSPKFALFFNLRNNISFKNLNEQKKTHQKILSFDEVMACQSSPFFGPVKNELKFSRGDNFL